MPLFDRPELKVQKDRRVCRNTDMRVAKYTRRGLLLSLLAFAIATALGDLRSEVPQLVLVLGIGLVLMTLVRGYYVFRFAGLYAAGPNRWRQRYFLSSTLGALWWGIILLCHVWLVGFAPETHFLWLYTVIFCSSVATVFAPYHRFLAWFISASLLPAAVAAFLSGDILGTIYGAATFIFVWLTAHQGRRESENYWDRIAAMYELQQRASHLVAASKHSEAAVALTNEFITNIGQEFRSQVADSMDALTLLEEEPLTRRQHELIQLAKRTGGQQLKLVDNVGLFARVARQDIHLRQGPFNLVKAIEKSFKFAADTAHQQHLELNFQIDDNLPVMVTGDNRRTGQLIRNLVDSATMIAHRGELWGQVSFEYINSAEGQLTIQLRDSGEGEILPEESELFGAFSRLDSTQVTTGLGLSIAKGLAEIMGGYMQLYSSDEGNRYQVAMKFAIEPNQRTYLTPDRRLQDHEVVLLHQGGLFVAGLVQVLNSFGMEVASHHWSDANRKAAEESLRQALNYGRLILLVPAMGDRQLLADVSAILADESESQSPLLCLGGDGHESDFAPLQQALPAPQYLPRPVTRKELHGALIERLFGGTKKVSRRIASRGGERPRQRSLLLIEETHQHGVAEEMLRALGHRVEVASSINEALERLPEGNYDLLLVDCQQNTEHSAQIIENLRRWEADNTPGDRLPIVALTSTTQEQFESRCLAAGMDSYLTKPLDRDSLRETLERWLGGV